MKSHKLSSGFVFCSNKLVETSSSNQKILTFCLNSICQSPSSCIFTIRQFGTCHNDHVCFLSREPNWFKYLIRIHLVQISHTYNRWEQPTFVPDIWMMTSHVVQDSPYPPSMLPPMGRLLPNMVNAVVPWLWMSAKFGVLGSAAVFPKRLLLRTSKVITI